MKRIIASVVPVRSFVAEEFFMFGASTAHLCNKLMKVRGGVLISNNRSRKPNFLVPVR